MTEPSELCLQIAPHRESVDWSIESLQQFDLTRDEAGIVSLFHQTIKAFYIPETDYHNEFEHIPESFLEAMRLCAVAKAAGLNPNILEVALAIIGHDAGFNHDLSAENYDTKRWGVKEDYHAHITGEVLKTLGLEEDLISGVKKRIVATGLETECETLEDEIVSMADTGNVASEYSNFVLKSCLFFRECVVREANLDLNLFRTISSGVLGRYFSRIKIMAELDTDENGRNYPERGYANIERFSTESVQSIMKILGAHANWFAGVLTRTVEEKPKDRVAS